MDYVSALCFISGCDLCVIERILAIKKAGAIDPKFMLVIKDNLLSGNVTAAKSYAKNTDNPVAKMIEKGILRMGKPLDTIEKSM